MCCPEVSISLLRETTCVTIMIVRTNAIQNTLKQRAVVMAASLQAVGYSKLSSSSSAELPGAACSTVVSPIVFSSSIGAGGSSVEVWRAEGVVEVVRGLVFSAGSFASTIEGAMVVACESAMEMGRKWPCCSLMWVVDGVIED